MSTNAIEIMNRGMSCLTENLGIVEAEQFISILISEKFDYTKWQKKLFDGMTPAQIDEAARQYTEVHPNRDKAKIVL